MRVSALLSRTKKFFSKKRRAAKIELMQIHADGVPRAQVESTAREFQAKAIKYESEAAFNTSKEKRLRKYLHNARVGRSDSDHLPLPHISTTLRISEEALMEKNDAKFNAQRAKTEREKAVLRRLYSQRMFKTKNKK